MKFQAIKAGRSLGLFCLLCASAANCFSLDREAFSFTHYDLTLQVDPEQHRLGVRGMVTLRNDTQSPQKIAVLQISSSLSWKSIKAGETTPQIVTQPFTSDIDHTGGLSEAIVTLPQSVAPKGTIDLTIAYEGVVLPDATRFTRTGVPDDVALSGDWDQIGENFTALRGAGYVAWYPISTEVANLSEEDSLFAVLKRWNAREADGKMDVIFKSTVDCTILSSGYASLAILPKEEEIAKVAVFHETNIGLHVPAFAMANYKQREAGSSKIYYLAGKEARAESYAALLSILDPLPSGPRRDIQVAELPRADAAPFLADGLLLMPLKPSITTSDRLTLVYGLAHRKTRSSHRWIVEGLAHCAQVLDLEKQQGRQAALDYLTSHLGPLVEFEKQSAASSGIANKNAEPEHTLLEMSDAVPMQSKAMYVWWMLKDMIPEAGMSIALFRYDYGKTDEDSSMQKLLEEPAQRDLQWFFDDWVYHDRGLPDFKVESAFASKTPSNSYMVTVTASNLGSAGAEVPVKIKFAGGETMKRLEVRAKSKGTIRIEVPAAPQEVVVNDGSVPESDMSNNTFKIEQGAK